MWLRKLMKDLGHPHDGPVHISCDNMATLALLLNTDMQSSRIKHIDNRHHQCREQVELGTVIYAHCASKDNLADCLTKPLPRASLLVHTAAMGISPLPLTAAP
jgi:hypothetical protein